MATSQQKNSQPLICSGHSRPVPDISFSEQTEAGFFLISACLDKNPMLRDGTTGDWIGTFEGHKGAVWCARLNPTTSHAVTASADFSARLWDAKTGATLQRFDHKHIVKTACFHEDSSKILTGGNEKILRIWDLAKPDTPEMVLKGHTAGIRAAFWLDTNLIASAGGDKQLRIFDVRQGEEISSTAVEHPILSMKRTFDKESLVLAAGKDVKIWDIASQSIEKTFSFEFDVGSAHVDRERNNFIVGGHNFWVHVCDYKTGEERDVLQGHHGPVHAVEFSPDGDLFASAGEDGTVRLWQTEVKPYGLWQLPLSAEEREKQREVAAKERERKLERERERQREKDRRRKSRGKSLSEDPEGAGRSPKDRSPAVEIASGRRERTASNFNPNAADFTPSFSPEAAAYSPVFVKAASGTPEVAVGVVGTPTDGSYAYMNDETSPTFAGQFQLGGSPLGMAPGIPHPQ